MKLLNFATFLTVISASAYAKTGLDDSALAAPKDFADVSLPSSSTIGRTLEWDLLM